MWSINLYSFALNIIKSCKMIEVNQKFYTPPHGVFSSPDRTERLQGRQMHPVRSGIASPGITKDIPIIYRLLNN